MIVIWKGFGTKKCRKPPSKVNVMRRVTKEGSGDIFISTETAEETP